MEYSKAWRVEERERRDMCRLRTVKAKFCMCVCVCVPKAKVLEAGGLVREALLRTLLSLPHPGVQHSWILWIDKLGKGCSLLPSRCH